MGKIIFLFLMIINFYSAQAQLDLDWHGSIKGPGSLHVSTIAKDNNNNFYIASRITDTIQDIDPTAAVYNLTAPVFSEYVSKHDSLGQVIMAFILGYGVGANSMFVDDNGYIFVCGEFSNCVDFDPSLNVVQLCAGSTNTRCGFYAKYSPLGNLEFVRKISTGPITQDVHILDAEFNSNGNCVMAIFCDNYLKVDSTPIPLSQTPGAYDVHIVEFDTTGANISSNLIDCTIWANPFYVYSIKYDYDGNYLVGGYMYGPGTIIGHGTQNVISVGAGGIIAKLKPDGTCVFAKEFLTGQIADIAPFTDHRTAFLGVFGQTSYGTLDSLGNLIYVEQIPGQGVTPGWLVSDSFDNFYISAIFDSTYSNPQTGLPAFEALANTDDFIARFDQNGKYSFFLPIEGSEMHTIWHNLILTDQNHLLNISSFTGICDFDLGLGIKTDTMVSLMDIGVTKYIIRDTPQSQSSYYRISGTVYKDDNVNGIKDFGEMPIPWQIVEIQPGNFFTMTDVNGFYMKYVPAGSYTITLPAFDITSGFNGSCWPIMNTAVLSSQIIHDTGNDFGLYTSSTQKELEVIITPVTPFQSGVPSVIQTTGKNNFLNNVVSKVKLKFNSLSGVSSTFPVATTLNTTEATWLSNGIAPFSSLSYLTTFMDTLILTPDSIIFSALIDSIANDIFPENNYDTITLPVGGSFDPNMKIVSPPGDITEMQIMDGLKLDYTIYFQNVGTAPAWRVIIIDTLAATLDLSTLEILDASHSPYSVSLEQGNILVFKFNNINLPDSTTNETASHGFVRYRMKPQPNLGIGSQIENGAGIIFDFNQPVITNMTINTIVAPVSISNELYVQSPLIYPTITSGAIYIQSSNINGQNYHLSICDAMGSPIILNKEIELNQNKIYQFTNEATGIYFLTITANNQTYNFHVVFAK